MYLSMDQEKIFIVNKKPKARDNNNTYKDIEYNT